MDKSKICSDDLRMEQKLSLCYNDYHQSKELGISSHVGCAVMGNCVSTSDMCRGVGQCSELVEDCNENLRCRGGEEKNNVIINNDGEKIASKLNFTIKGGHHFFCSYKTWENTKTYENIDRSDEKSIINLYQSGPIKQPKSICAAKKGEGKIASGLSCNQKGNTKCLERSFWCRENSYQFTCNLEDGPLQSNDVDLCKNHIFWRDIDCNIFFNTSDGVLEV